jgi:hypothetical protein
MQKIERSAEKIPKNGHRVISKPASIPVQAIRLIIVHPEKQREITRRSWFKRDFGLFIKTNSPTNKVKIVTGICE